MTRVQYRVTVPEGELDGLKVERFTIGRDDFSNFKLGARATSPGTYTALRDRGRLWMSDTDAEIRDHLPAIWRAQEPETRRVLLNGLGLGMVLKAVLACEHVGHVDVVEIDQRVIDLIGPHYADPRLTIHHADAYTMAWPTGMRWDVAWHDIWPDLCTDNLPEMGKLHRRYGRRVRWQGSWGKELLQSYRRRGY